MSARYKVSQVAYGTIARVYCLKISSGIRTVDATATWINGHEPHDVDTQLAQVAKFCLCRDKGAGAGETANIHLIDNTIFLAHGSGEVNVEWLCLARHNYLARWYLVIIDCVTIVAHANVNVALAHLVIAHQVELTISDACGGAIVVGYVVQCFVIVTVAKVKLVVVLAAMAHDATVVDTRPWCETGFGPGIECHVAPPGVVINIDFAFFRLYLKEDDIINIGNVRSCNRVVTINVTGAGVGHVVEKNVIVKGCHIAGSDCPVTVHVAMHSSFATRECGN